MGLVVNLVLCVIFGAMSRSYFRTQDVLIAWCMLVFSSLHFFVVLTQVSVLMSAGT